MTSSFDFHTLSVTVDRPLEEYTASLTPTPLGLHVWEVGSGDRSQVLRYRHEHAHFTSFLASGLADLYGVFSDYTLAFLYAALRRQMTRAPGRALSLPLLAGGDDDGLRGETRARLRRAWGQVNELRAFFFGFPTEAPLAALLAPRAQDHFWETHFHLPLSEIVNRFYRLLARLAVEAEATPKDPGALPLVEVNGVRDRLSARAVMEAYAIGIELLNTHFRKVESSHTHREPIVRDPGSLYTIAIEYLLQHGPLRPVATLGQFLGGQAPPDAYYLLVAVAFASLQVPVVQEPDGEVRFEGRLECLSPAHRFRKIVDAMARGEIAPLAPSVRSGRDELMAWLAACHQAVGDRDSLAMCRAAHDLYERDATLAAKPSHEKSMIQLAWAARANFDAHPNEYVLDAGLFAERYACQMRYVRTADAKLVMPGDAEKFRVQYLADHTTMILEGAVFAEQWDSTWDKLPEIAPRDRAAIILSSIAWAACLFGDLRPGREWRPPTIEIRM